MKLVTLATIYRDWFNNIVGSRVKRPFSTLAGVALEGFDKIIGGPLNEAEE